MRLHAPTNTPPEPAVQLARLDDPERPDRPPLRLGVHAAASAEGLDGSIDRSVAPFVPVAAVAALFAGQDLEIDAPVSSTQVDGVRSATELLARWFDLRPSTIRADADADGGASPGSGVGLFFTSGIDSWARLLQARNEITHLVFVDGAEPLHGPEMRRRMVAAIGEAASRTGVPLIVVSTNARDRLDELAPWDHTHGAAIASAALLASPTLAVVHVASSHPGDTTVRWGTHPDLDHRWSTTGTRFVHDPERLSRWDKTALVAQHQPALDTLHVCWQGGSDRNCGRCRKCLLTMSALHGVEALDRTDRFDGSLDPTAIAALERRPAGRNTNALDVIGHLPADSEIAGAWASVVDRDDLRRLSRRRSLPRRLRRRWWRRRPA